MPWCTAKGKPGAFSTMPCHHNLETNCRDYIEAAALAGDRKVRFFAPTTASGILTDRAMTRSDAACCRRARAAGIPNAVCNQPFRATGTTAYLDNSGSLEKRPSDGRTRPATKLYDRTDVQITLDEVEQIGISTKPLENLGKDFSQTIGNSSK
jgi:integrase/recombinase XerD